MIPISLPVGVFADPTDAEKSASWRLTNFMRWDGIQLTPVKGWEQYAYTAPSTPIRAIHTWRDLNSREWTAYLTHGDIFVEYDGNLVSVAPTPALEVYVEGAGGYGDFTYNYDDYGDARPAIAARKGFGPCFTLDNYGETLLIMSSVDGRLLQWTPPAVLDPPDPCVVVTNAPTGCRTFVVTPERIVKVFCPGGDTSSYQWCDQEGLTDWTPGIASFAGDLPVEPASPVVGAVETDAGTLFITARKAYLSEFIGLPYIYRTLDKSDGVAPISAATLKRMLGGALWVSEAGFWRLSGISIEPVRCEIWSWIIENIDWDAARYLAASMVIETQSEYWFSFPSKGSDHNDLTAVLNFRDGWWAMHGIGRSAGFSSSYSTYPVMADRTVAYKHESGPNFAGTSLMPFAETFTMNALEGELMATMRQIQPELEGDFESVRFSFAVKRTRGNASSYTPKRRVQSNGLVDIDETARDFRLRVDQTDTSDGWTLGPVLLDMVSRGKMP